jgi:tRNA pseudouridine32 synthase/23S rRNA pseudouridine746 synthase
MYEPGGGKMLGVLLATTPLSVAPKASSSSEESSEERAAPKPAGDASPANVVVLKAFSGQLYGEWRVPGWAPPTCGLTHDSPHYVAAHAAIRDATAASAAKKTAADAIEEDIRAVSSRWDAEIERAAAKMRDARRERNARRAAAPAEARVALDARLAEESRAGKRALARLRDGKRAELAAATEALRVTRAEFERLREVRRAASATLLGEIFDSYRLPNFRDAFGFGGRRSGADETSSSATIDHGGGLTGATLREAFCAVTEEGDLEDGRAAVASSPPSSLPCGCGDCCAPKLLAECARRGLAPVAIAEVWMGAPTRKDGERQEGGFYGACRGRCRPILGHMLCGAEELTRERGPIRLETGERASAANIYP